MEGVLNIHKPSGITSHGVVQRVRSLFRERRAGHTGTLDPSATGVLVVCIGRATRIAQYLEAGEKEYQAVMKMGITTDTCDADGRVLCSRTYIPPGRSRILQVLQQFSGTIVQVPPVYSAVKVRGVPSYRLARQGKAEPLKPRSVTVHHIDLEDYHDPFLHLRIRCSKGVYIRTLCSDLGETLGAGGHMTELVRLRSGRFHIADALTLEQLALMNPNELSGALVPMNEALADIPAINLRDADSRKISHGMRIKLEGGPSEDSPVLVRIQDENGRLVALGKAGQGSLRPETVF